MSAGPIEADRRQILLAGAGASAALLTPTLGSARRPWADAMGPGRAQPFDSGWRFRRGEGAGLEVPGFDDNSWRRGDLPHDWSIEDLVPSDGVVGPFDKASPGGVATGFSVGGEGWYRKRFHLRPMPGSRAEIRFDGVYRDSDVWLNGHHLGGQPSGYMPFAYDLTPYLSANGDNVIAVRVRNLGQNSRWYSGSGIYRHVWLDVFAQPTRIARWGIGVTTRRIEDAGASIEIATRLQNIDPDLDLALRIKDDRGRIIWTRQVRAVSDGAQLATIGSPRLWSPASPTLYTLETELRRGAHILDHAETTFGIRIVAFNADTGMTINGVATKLRGGCVHHDNGLLGAAAFDAAEGRKVALMKARGYNAVRPSHNPFSPAFLRACDEQGMLVICEAFDAWRAPKLQQDYSVDFDAHWQTDLATMVLSARNHPSIILWSIGNEIPKRNLPEGVATQWRLANEVHRLDPSRPVTAAINDFAGRLVVPTEQTARPGRAGLPDEASAVFLDVVGYNYKFDLYERDHARFPKRIIYGSESFPKDMFAIWELTDRSPWLLGDFVWTAMDYLGEAGIGGSALVDSKAASPLAAQPAWPEIVSQCGDIDLIGGRKAASFARDVLWGISPLEIAVQAPVASGKVELIRRWGWSDERQSWTWPGFEGKALTVRIYTVGDRIELRLNGRIVATHAITAVDRLRAEVQVDYAPGIFEIIAFRDGLELARRSLETTGSAVAIRLSSEKAIGGSGIGEVRYVGIDLVDTKGRTVQTADSGLTISLAGPVTLAAFGNADPRAHGGFQSLTGRSWRGRALAILRGTGTPGQARIEVRGAGLSPAAAMMTFERSE
ncbi:glycoside hydrolase family 2 TIM barrel-domain containing protein [Sphingomonas solaris]|uniref:Glycoside hydrolase family 2 protein n=1 Tax=Alterirhizorhabdus solaris TaxID=2529389 RepID=A0A558R469_9SPHN|nr:glycoside hydrolase family 2 TIM barrel-domain containing protein [Sphingomonas solaris]TVV74170.1 glycoside hydrolase family 2 protein [Sphingomonas solaris]